MHPLKKSVFSFKRKQNKQRPSFLPPTKWKKDRWEKFLYLYSEMLITIAALTIIMNPIWILVFAGREAGAYQYTEEQQGVLQTVQLPGMKQEIQADNKIVFNNVTIQKKPEYRQITKREDELIQLWASQINWTGMASLIGWCNTNPRFKKNLAQIISKLKKSFEKN